MTTLAKGTGASGAAVAWVGELGLVPLAEVIRRIVVEECSGELRCTSVSGVKAIHFDRGFIVFAASNVKSDSLGERLISSGRISPHEFALVTMLTKGSKRSFRQTLSHAGIVPEEELGRHVAAQVNQIVLSLFSWSEGEYRFTEAPCAIPLELMVSLSAHRILLEGIRRMSSGKLILAGLPPLDTMIRVVQAPPFSLDFEKLRQVEKSVLRIADTRITIREILTRAGEDKGKVLRACYALYAAGVLESVNEDARRRPRPVQEETGTFVVSEILRKIAPKEHAAEPAKRPPIVKKPGLPSKPQGEEAPHERLEDIAETPPSVPSVWEGEQAEAAEAAPKPGLKSFEEFEAEQAAITGDAQTGDGKPNIWSRASSVLIATATALWAAITAAWGGAGLLWKELRAHAQRERLTEEMESPADSEDSLRARAPYPLSEDPLATLGRRDQLDEVGQEDASGGPTVPSWSLVDDPEDAPLPTTDPKEFLAEADDTPEITRLGVPEWSLRDDPDAAPAPPVDTYQEMTPPEPPSAAERLEPPSWSLEDRRTRTAPDPNASRKARTSSPAAPREELVLGVEDMEPAAPAASPPGRASVPGHDDQAGPPLGTPAAGEFEDPFADPLFGHPDDRPPTTQELFIELEPEDDTESSMLKAIPVEDVHVDDEPDLVIVVEEDAFEDLPDVPEDPTPPPVRQPPAQPVQQPEVRTAKPSTPKPAPPVKATPSKSPVAAPRVPPREPAPEKKKLPGPPRIVPRVEKSPAKPRVTAEPQASPVFSESAGPTFNEDSVPIFNEAPLVPSTKAPTPAPPVKPASPPGPPPAKPSSPVAPTPPRPVAKSPASPPPPRAVAKAPASPAAPTPPGPVARPPASPAVRPPVAQSLRPSPSRAEPQATPPVQAPISIGGEQPSVSEPSAGDLAVNEGLMRANRIRQRGGEKRLLRDVKLHFKVQDWAGAVPLLEELVAIAPGSALYRGMLARAMSREPNLRSDAEEHFHEALRLAPQDPEIHYWLGVYYLSFGLKARALNEFKTTLRINPNHQRARQHLGAGRGGGGGVFKKLFG